MRRRYFFRRGYDVIATWRNGKRKIVVHFGQKDCADYWLEVEGPHWLRQRAWPESLTRLGISAGP